jgi:hypothetical protein
MSALDPTSEAIIAAYIENGGSQIDAWRITHPDSKASAKTLAEKASRFFAQGNVRARIVELHAEVAAKASANLSLTLESHMAKLAELCEEARARGQLSAAITAEVKRGEAARLYVRQVESTVTTRTAEQLDDAELASIAAGSGSGTVAASFGSKKLN